MGRIGEHPVGFLLPLPPNLFGPLEKLLVLFGDLLLGLAGEGHPPVFVVLVGLVLLKNQVSVFAEIESAALKDFGIFGRRFTYRMQKSYQTFSALSIQSSQAYVLWFLNSHTTELYKFLKNPSA